MFGSSIFRPRVADAFAATAAPAVAGCFHCGLPLPQPVADWIEFEGTMRPLCCASCHAAAGMVIAAGLGAYYHERAAPARSLQDAGRS